MRKWPPHGSQPNTYASGLKGMVATALVPSGAQARSILIANGRAQFLFQYDIRSCFPHILHRRRKKSKREKIMMWKCSRTDMDQPRLHYQAKVSTVAKPVPKVSLNIRTFIIV
ncbi:unnamed protein product [Caretta caretta]